MAWFRSRRSPYQGGMIVSGVMSASWAASTGPSGRGQGRASGQRGAVRAVERERAASAGGRRGDEVAAVVDHLVMPGAQADQVVQVGAAAVDPVLDVVQVDPAGLAAGVPAPAVVAFAGGAADRGAGPAPAAAQGQDRAGAGVGHPGQRGGAADHLRGGHADRRAVLDVAPGRIGRVTRDPRPGRRFRGNAGDLCGRGRRRGERAGAGVDHDLVHLRVIGPGDLPGQERLGHRDQAVSQVRRRPDRRGVRGGRPRPRVRRAIAAAAGVAAAANAPRKPRIAGQVGAGGAERLQQHRAGQGRQAERAGQRPVLLEPPGQTAAHPGIRVIRPGDLAVGPGEPLQLVGGHWLGQLGQPALGGRGGDPGQRPDLGVRQLRRGEPGPDDRQVPQRPGHPDVLAGGAGGQLALPRQPLRAGAHLPAGPAAAGVEVGEQDQEPAGCRGQVPGQLADLRLHPLQRHRRRLSRGRGHVGRRQRQQARMELGLSDIEHIFTG